ncbi:NifB/NifX family molybdenum-iron cluster-binding protein [Anaerosporobacter sp.]
MSYKIAYVSSDGIYIDRTFGAAEEFIIVAVSDGEYRIIDTRKIEEEKKNEIVLEEEKEKDLKEEFSCGSGSGCGRGQGSSTKVDLISDCRCVICKKVGFHIQKQLERLAITTFDVDYTVEEALRKIILYFERIDGHKSLRGITSSNKE